MFKYYITMNFNLLIFFNVKFVYINYCERPFNEWYTQNETMLFCVVINTCKKKK